MIVVFRINGFFLLVASVASLVALLARLFEDFREPAFWVALIISDRQSSLSSESSDYDEPLDAKVHREFGEKFGSSESSELTPNSKVHSELTNEPNKLSPQSKYYFEEVLEALEDGLNDSKIIKDVMGFKGEKYKEGKAILEEIKRFIELNDEA